MLCDIALDLVAAVFQRLERADILRREEVEMPFSQLLAVAPFAERDAVERVHYAVMRLSELFEIFLRDAPEAHEDALYGAFLAHGQEGEQLLRPSCKRVELVEDLPFHLTHHAEATSAACSASSSENSFGWLTEVLG